MISSKQNLADYLLELSYRQDYPDLLLTPFCLLHDADDGSQMYSESIYSPEQQDHLGQDERNPLRQTQLLNYHNLAALNCKTQHQIVLTGPEMLLIIWDMRLRWWWRLECDSCCDECLTEAGDEFLRIIYSNHTKDQVQMFTGH